jgi:K+-transporting ATPase KdpF subunit
MAGLPPGRLDDARHLPIGTTSGSRRDAIHSRQIAALAAFREADPVIWLGLLCLAALLGYLFYALIKPERF